ncbi:MAG: helix-turn-helix domain-containing protein, partial [Gemmataceae bacterium]
ESRTIRVDVRVVAATNASLEELVEQGHFREDLYYRLNVVPILLPPLRERRDDIEPLARFFVKRYVEANKIPQMPEMPDALVRALREYEWPGNVRELENTIERLIVLSEGDTLEAEHLRFDRPRMMLRSLRGGPGGAIPQDIPGLIKALVRQGAVAPLPAGKKLYHYLVGGLERELIEHTLRLCDGVQLKAAERLGINRNTLHKKMEEFQAEDAKIGSAGVEEGSS